MGRINNRKTNKERLDYIFHVRVDETTAEKLKYFHAGDVIRQALEEYFEKMRSPKTEGENWQ
jgi:hypothetical protein